MLVFGPKTNLKNSRIAGVVASCALLKTLLDPKRLQDAPKMGPRCPKRFPRCAQDAYIEGIMKQVGSQDGLKKHQDAPKMGSRGPEMLQDAPRWAQDVPKMAPRCSKRLSR